MNTDPLSPSRRDLLLMTGLATAGAVVAAQRGSNPAPAPAPHTTVLIDVRDHGALGDGSSDDSAAVAAALQTASAAGTSSTVYFPKGVYKITAGTLIVPHDNPMVIRGDGPHASQISFLDSDPGSGDLVTLSSPFSALENLQLDGGGAQGDSDLLVLNGSYNRVSNCSLSGSPGDGLAIGKASRSIAHVVENVTIRDAKGYGIRVHGTSNTEPNGSTDGLWVNVDIGRSGLSGVFLESSSQNMSNVHVWQSGVRAGGKNSDQHGFRVSSRSHIFSGCQAETNLGDGFHFENGGGEGCVVTGCRVWENGGAGLVGEKTRHLTITGTTFMRNGRNNVGDSASAIDAAAAAIRNEGGDGWAITGCAAWDDSKSLSAVQISGDTSASEIPSRGSQMTQTFAYVETGTKGGSVITGGILRAEDHLSRNSILSSSPLLKVIGADLGSDDVPSVESADSVTLPAWGDLVNVTGTAKITSIAPGRPGRTVTLAFPQSGAAGLSGTAAGVILSGDFVPQVGAAIMLIYIGSKWRELNRSS
ncbi:right-handed parallel beta-helix repeat-containing protein [Microbacterium arborescens]|nr:right-handed parallel beta-helix repeat-containing protein [Microbacterium arborescens]